jgi:hypothetical protein
MLISIVPEVLRSDIPERSMFLRKPLGSDQLVMVLANLLTEGSRLALG